MDLTAEERTSDSPFIQRVWRSRTSESGTFISMAQPDWSMVITRTQGKAILTVRGPETKATAAVAPANAEFVGIEFMPGTIMPDIPAKMVMDRNDLHMPEAGDDRFWLKGAAWHLFTYENADTFVDWLVRDGLLLYDPLVSAVLRGRQVDTSLRTVQRRFLQATGLTQGTVNQIDRARYATILLTSGMSILDVVDQAGYADQPHMTRSLKVLIGQTPAQLTSENRSERLSLLFKTPPPDEEYDTNVRISRQGAESWERKSPLLLSSASSSSASGSWGTPPSGR